MSPRDPGSSARREDPSREGGPGRSQGFGIQRRASGGEAWGEGTCERGSRAPFMLGGQEQKGSFVWFHENSDLGMWGLGLLPHLLVKVNVLGAEDTAIGGGCGFKTGTEARERPRGGTVFRRAEGLEAGQSVFPVALLAFQLEEYMMIRVPQGCCSVSDNPGTALVLLGEAEGKKNNKNTS